MANAKQVSVLGEGLEVWNRWRAEHSQEPIDLSNADLRGFEFGLMPALRRADEQGLIPKGVSWQFVYNEIVEALVAALAPSQPGPIPLFLIACAASGEVRNFRSAAAPAGFPNRSTKSLER